MKSPNCSQTGTQRAGASQVGRIPLPANSPSDSAVKVQQDHPQHDIPSPSNNPLPPAACTTQSDGQQLNHMEEFSEPSANLQAVDRCLDAACALLQFEIAEVWTYAGEMSTKEGKVIEPLCWHVYVRPATIESFEGKVQRVWKEARHDLSKALVDKARREEGLLWYTSTHEDTPLQAGLALNTAVTLPISLAMFRKDLCFVFFGQHDVQRTDTAVSVLTELSRAAGVAISAAFQAYIKGIKGIESGASRIHKSSLTSPTPGITSIPEEPCVEAPVDLDVRWDELKDVEFMVNGSRCTIYTAFYRSQGVVVKVVRKDAVDKDLVSKELDLEISLLMRLHHPNIVRLMGAGTQPERFMIIERLDGGTLAQRCGNALKIRDRRRKFRHKRPFTYEEILTQGMQLARALRYMHNDAIPGKMVLHRDLKPDNIGFDSDGNLKLIDLGLGKVMTKSSEDKAVYKMTGQTGSLRYMAPEVALEKPYNGAADVYGFSMILWEMSTMTKPFLSMDYPIFMRQVAQGGVRPHLSKNWQPEFAALLESCWHPDMHKRMQLDEILATLKCLHENAATRADRARSVQRPAPRRFRIFPPSSRKNANKG